MLLKYILQNISIGIIRKRAQFLIDQIRYTSNIINNYDITKIRNVGIMAHIDAGKTTTTERMLYYTGKISSPGEVHKGDTVTDFLPQERERGITIQSAIVTFQWNQSLINLVDTPGHVDFTFEVERSLRVMDSAIAILDASAGVEAQTLTVWRQSCHYKLPKLIYLNKMDKLTASVQMCIQSIKEKLKVIPILIQLPIYQKSNMKNTSKNSGVIGLIDLIHMKKIIFNPGTKGADYTTEDCRGEKDLLGEHYELIETLADLDSELASYVIESESLENIPATMIEAAVKRVTSSSAAVPVLLGSSYKNVGVQPLMDALELYLPAPNEVSLKDPIISAYGKDLCIFAFKTIYDRQLGLVTFVRVFNGTLVSGQKVFNLRTNKHEKVLKTYLAFADEFKEVCQLQGGEIGVISGLKETITGDTITSSSTVAGNVLKRLKSKSMEHETACLLGVNVPQPVFFCSVEPASLSHQKGLDMALECLKKEDPSLKVNVDQDTGQTILSGMGELHLEIIHQRLKSEFKVEADIGKLMVAYKETILDPIVKRITFERRLADQLHSVTLELDISPSDLTSGALIVRKGVGREILENLKYLTDRQLRCINNGVEAALRTGPKLCFPVIQLDIKLNYLQVGRGTSETILEAAAASCVREALQEVKTILLEPIVSLEIAVDENYQPLVIDDLNRRKFKLENIDFKYGNKIITGTAPLNELLGYSTALRTISSGLGTLTMQFSHYRKVTNFMDEQQIIGNGPRNNSLGKMGSIEVISQNIMYESKPQVNPFCP